MAVIVLAIGGCGESAPTKVVHRPISEAPSPACAEVNARLALAANPPQLFYALKNQDVANFTGDTEVACNQRQLVYWGPDPGLPNRDRPMIFTRLYFASGALSRNADALVGRTRRVKRDGSSYRLASISGASAARFVIGHTVVTVTAGCTDATNIDNLSPVPCQHPVLKPSVLPQRALAAAAALRPALDRALGGA